jgi:hypothetical protein
MICRSCLYHIRDLRRIRHLGLDNAKTLPHALESNRLDYCNSYSLLSGIAEKDIMKLLQRVQNRLAYRHELCAVFLCCPPFIDCWNYDVNLNLLADFQYTEWKTTGLYIHEMLVPSVPVRSLRSNQGIKLPVPKVRAKTGATDLCNTRCNTRCNNTLV